KIASVRNGSLQFQDGSVLLFPSERGQLFEERTKNFDEGLLEQQFPIPLLSMERNSIIARDMQHLLSDIDDPSSDKDEIWQLVDPHLHIDSSQVDLQCFNNQGYSGGDSCNDFAMFLSGYGV